MIIFPAIFKSVLIGGWLWEVFGERERDGLEELVVEREKETIGEITVDHSRNVGKGNARKHFAWGFGD